MVFLTASLSIHNLRSSIIWSLELWKWCVLVLVSFCGRLFTEWSINILVFAIERNCLHKRVLLINRGVKRSKRTAKILNLITRSLGSGLIGAAMWVVKTFLALSGHSLMEDAGRIGSSRASGQRCFKSMDKGKQQEKEAVIDVVKLQKMNREKISAWTMGNLIKVIRSSGLSTLSKSLDSEDDDDDEGV